MKSITVVLLSILTIRFLFGEFPMHGIWWLDAIAFSVLLTLLGIHSRVVYKVIEGRRIEKATIPQYRGVPELQLIPSDNFDLQRHTLGSARAVLFAIRRHVALALPALMPLAAAVVLVMTSAVLFVVQRAIAIPSATLTPDSPLFPDGKQFHTPEIHLAIWWIPMLLGVRMIFWAARIWQDWKWDPLWTLTERYFYIIKLQSALFPHPTETKYDPIRTNQISHVDVSVGYWGTFFGGLIFRNHGEFGIVTLTVQSVRREDEPDRKIVLKWVPRAKEVATLIASVSTDLRDDVEISVVRDESAQTGAVVTHPAGLPNPHDEDAEPDLPLGR
jgi:hypothetical protein